MPTYHFRCKDCDGEWSIQMPMGATEMPACQTCNKTTRVVKIIRPPMVHFKGSGFYTTDSSGKGSQAKQEPKESKETKDVKPPETKKEATKPTAKASDTSK